MKSAYFSSECLYKCIFDILMYQNVVRYDACLAAVQCLAPCDSLCCNSDVRCLVDDAWTLSAEFQNHRSKILCSSFHDCLCESRASSEEYHVPSLLEQCCVYLPVALNYCDISFFKCLRDHFLDDLGYIRYIRRWLQHGCTSCRNRAYERVQQELYRVVPWRYDQCVAKRLLYDITS